MRRRNGEEKPPGDAADRDVIRKVLLLKGTVFMPHLQIKSCNSYGGKFHFFDPKEILHNIRQSRRRTKKSDHPVPVKISRPMLPRMAPYRHVLSRLAKPLLKYPPLGHKMFSWLTLGTISVIQNVAIKIFF